MIAIDISKIKPAESAKKKEKEGSISGFLNKDISLFGNGLNNKKKERFYSELAILLTAGVSIKTALELLADEQPKKKEKILFTAIKDRVVAGSSFSESIAESGKFTPYEYHSIKIGEESGQITEVLNELAKFFNSQIKQQRQIVSSLSYPCIVLLTAFGAIFFMLKFVVPMFGDIFKRFGGDLPALTKFVIKLSNGFSSWFGLFALLVISIISFFSWQRKKEWFRKASSSLLLKIPLIGEMMKKIYLARFCHSMHLLISSRTPLVTALDLVKKMIGFYPMEKSLYQVREDVVRGDALNSSLAKFPVYNKRMVSLIKVAEEVNQLDLIFEKLAKQYNDEVDHQTAVMGTLIEPIMIIFIGLIVALILVAMYLPLFQLSSSIKY